MNRNEQTSKAVASEAALYLNHAPDMITRMEALAVKALGIADDATSAALMLRSGMKIAASVLTQAPDRVGTAPADSTMTNAEIRDKNG